MSQILSTANKTYLALVFHRGEAPEDDLYTEYSVLVSQHAKAAEKELQGHFCHLPEVSHMSREYVLAQTAITTGQIFSDKLQATHETHNSYQSVLFVCFLLVCSFCGDGQRRKRTQQACICLYICGYFLVVVVLLLFSLIVILNAGVFLPSWH